MKMPFFSYFFVMGTVLTGLLLIINNYLEPSGEALRTSQTIGVPEPFKPEPERSPYEITAVNFAASRATGRSPQRDLSGKIASSTLSKKLNAATKRKLPAAPAQEVTRNHVAANSYNQLMSIH